MTNTINADPAELEKFSSLAHRWWDPESEFKPLHQINPLRLEWIDGQAPLQGKRVLDVGCGGGILADSMARKGAEVMGVDLATKALRVAQLHALETGTPIFNTTRSASSSWRRSGPRPDVVTCMEMLEHVPDPSSIVRACATLVRPGGWVFFHDQPQCKGLRVGHCGGRVCAQDDSPALMNTPSCCAPANWRDLLVMPGWMCRVAKGLSTIR